MKFKKIATVLGSALMVGSTLGLAAAAAYPAPFVQNGAANVAIVVGTAGAEASDMVAATDISADLAKDLSAQAVGGVKTVTGGENFKLDKDSDHMQFNEALNSTSGFATLGADDMDFLADGTYDDGAIDEDYEQTITLSGETLTLFADNKYKNDAPAIGYWFDNTENVLSYTIEFDNAINLTEMIGTNMPLLGGNYYVLDADADTLTLLDSADSTILADGEEVTVEGKAVSIEFIDDNEVKLNVNGEVTDKLSEGDTYKLDDGSFVAVTEILSSTRESTVQKVEFSIGSGKIILEDSSDTIFGEDTNDEIDGLTSTIVASGDQLTSVTINWNSDDDTFLTEGGVITMPGFNVLGLEFAGLNYPSDSETITVENGDTLTLVMGNYEIPLMWMNSSGIQALGEEDYVLDITNASTTYATAGFLNSSIPFWETSNVSVLGGNATVLSTGLSVEEDSRFVVTRIDTDLSDVETLYYELSDISTDKTTAILTLNDMIGTDDLVFDEVGDTDEHGDVTVTLDGFNLANTTAYLSFTAGSDVITYNKVVSEKGMVITLPASAANTTTVVFTEADKEGDVGAGESFTADVDQSSDSKLYVSFAGVNTEEEETTSDNVYLAIVTSALASKITTNEPTGDDSEYDFEVEYFGAEVTADVSVTAGGAVKEADSSLGTVTVLDSEADKMTGKNLIVVGGNCVNSVAASLLGLSAGASCMADFSAKTGVANGGYLIQSFDKGGKVALLVAGYSAADTTKAKTYLVNNNVETMVGTKLKGTSATEATVVTA